MFSKNILMKRKSKLLLSFCSKRENHLRKHSAMYKKRYKSDGSIINSALKMSNIMMSLKNHLI